MALQENNAEDAEISDPLLGSQGCRVSLFPFLFFRFTRLPFLACGDLFN